MIPAPETLITARLTGRRLSRSDLPYIVATDTDWDIQKTTSGAIQTPDQSQTRLRKWLQMWDEHGFGFWIFRDSVGNGVGHAGLFPSARDVDSIEVGYALPRIYWNHGYATEMSAAVLEAGFGALALPRIVAIADVDNAASRRVMEKAGMQYEGEFFYQDHRRSVRYACEREAWLSRRNTK